MPDFPAFLRLPARPAKPRSRGITHVLDSGLTLESTASFARQCAHLTDIVKIGWGISYVDPDLRSRVALYAGAGCQVSLGGTLLEVAEMQGRVGELADWAQDVGIGCVEVSDGLCALPEGRKPELISGLAGRFTVLAETGAKRGGGPRTPEEWAKEMSADLDAGAALVIAEGRESGTTGLYHPDRAVREDLVPAIVDAIGLDKVIFEAPVKNQQAWFIRQLGAEVNIGNVAPADVLPLETLRLGLRADTAPLGGTP